MEASGGDETLFECFGEIESWVLPDIRDGARWIEEHGSAVVCHCDPRADHLVFEVSSEERQGRLVGVFGEPSSAPIVVTRVWFGVEDHDGRVELSDRGRIDFDVQRAVVPMPQGFAQVDTVHDAGGEFFGTCQVGTEELSCAFDYSAAKAFDLRIFFGPRALHVGIPSAFPTLLIAWLGRAL